MLHYKYVLGLEVAVNDAITMQETDTLQDVLKHGAPLLESKRTLGDELIEATRLVVLHDSDIGLTLEGLERVARLISRDVWVGELLHLLILVTQTQLAVLRVNILHLERYVLMLEVIVCTVYTTETTLAQEVCRYVETKTFNKFSFGHSVG